MKDKHIGDNRPVTDKERRAFLKLGLKITGVVAGGTMLSTVSLLTDRARADELNLRWYEPSKYKPHYCMVIRQNLCVDCERCMDACVKTNNVPAYGYRTTIMEKRIEVSPGRFSVIFRPVLCNQCMDPPCVRVCPTMATHKDPKTGIVIMDSKKCIGCKTCMAACPYNARYFNEEKRAVDKCNFCFDTRLSKGEKLTACAEACPAKVRVFGDLTDRESEVYQLIHQTEKTVWVLRPETGAKPNIFYLNV